MQPNNSPESLAAIKCLGFTGKYLVTIPPSSPRLMPISFNFRSNLGHERDYLPFVGEISYGYWAISLLRKYL